MYKIINARFHYGKPVDVFLPAYFTGTALHKLIMDILDEIIESCVNDIRIYLQKSFDTTDRSFLVCKFCKYSIRKMNISGSRVVSQIENKRCPSKLTCLIFYDATSVLTKGQF